MVECARVMLLVPLLLAANPLSSAECGACHTEAFETWSRSRHAASATNATYRASHALEPMPWCDSCHAPQGVDEGISCAACHVREGLVLSTRAPSPDGERAHAMRQDVALGGSGLCAGCHQFNFPTSRTEPVRFSSHPMQNTFVEWQATGTVRPCQACHASHDPQGPHDVTALRASLRAVARRERDEVSIALEPVGVAHRFPTGDPFRRLELSLCRDVDCTGVVARRELEREVQATSDGWRLARDLTLPPTGLTVSLKAPGARFVRVSYRYAARSSEAALEADERETILFTQPILEGATP